MTIETFWTRVDKNGPVMRPGLTPCWTWLGDKTSKGYGMLNWPHLARTATGRLVRMYAHRFSYQLHHSTTVPADLVVCHECDNPSCVNPEHHFVGTSAQNSADMKAKGRSTWGEKNPQAKLTEEKVREIKRMLREGRTQQRIANTFAVTREAISQISRGNNWAHIQ